MYKELELRDFEGNKKSVFLLANAMTAIRYKQLFKIDLMQEFGSMMKASKMNDADATEYLGDRVEMLQRLAFIMHSAAMREDMNKLTLEGYYEWLEPFDAMTFYEHGEDIIGVYMSQKKASSKAKK